MTRDQYIDANQAAYCELLREAHRDGYSLEESGVRQMAHIARAAGEHYDIATQRGWAIRKPTWSW